MTIIGRLYISVVIHVINETSIVLEVCPVQKLILFGEQENTIPNVFIERAFVDGGWTDCLEQLFGK